MSKLRHHRLFPDASSLLQQLRDGQITTSKLVSDHLKRLLALQPSVNAAVRIYQREALEIASNLDVKANFELPLSGLPCSIKETFSIAGEHITAGSLRKIPVRQCKDAEMVRRIKNAGAIIIARSNIPEFAMTGESSNPRFGRCNNPLDTSRVAGGSSGGEGALVTSGASSFGLGSDILGSIRIPAALCGVVGYKGHSSAINSSGTWPEVTGNTKTWLGFGPITRSVRDAQLVYNVIAEHPIRECSGLFKYVTIPQGFPISYRQACIRDAVTCAQQTLVRSGINSRQMRLSRVPKLFLQIPRIIIDDFYDTWIADLSSGPHGRFSMPKEILAKCKGSATIDSGLLNWLALKPFMKSRNPEKREKIAKDFSQAKKEYRQFLGPDTVLLLPTLGLVAPKHKQFNRLSLMDPRVNGLFTSHTLG